MMNIPRHKVFISYYHEDDQEYKNELINMCEFDKDLWQMVSIFEDYSVHEDEIDDNGMTDEQVRCEIRDNYIAGATVLILLCGKNTKHRKHIDWEIHAAMYDSQKNPKMGILVIDLPSIATQSTMIACNDDEREILGPYEKWIPASRELNDIHNAHPYLPERIATNLTREDVDITIASWNRICNDPHSIKVLIDNAFKRRNKNNYDHSAKLKGRNS